MATRKDVEAKADREGFAVRTWRNPESQRVHYRFFRVHFRSPGFSYTSPGFIETCIGARAALQWLKHIREARLAKEDALDLAAQAERA